MSIETRYIIATSVVDCRVIDNQWFVHFDGSRESIAFGHKDEERPFIPGDEVEITFKRTKQNAKSS